MITIRPIPAFNDNYIWHLQQGRENWVIDPGDSTPVLRALGDAALHGILLTHHHLDHTGGVKSLTDQFDCSVYGPGSIEGVTKPLTDGDKFSLMGCDWEVLSVPGHTLDHIALLLHQPDGNHLFCGDTLFAAGCGRLFEGTPEQMHHSLSRLAALPPSTRVYCAHEYTLANLAFAQAVEPGNHDIEDRIASARSARAKNQPTLPSTISSELKTNPFLRTQSPEVRARVASHGGSPDGTPVEIFASLRQWKDNF
ncbi:hydroxyacylglutathione hydrolase [Microbulbifer hydrolyticus]|uniref:Hydroxyacylglutathione hydrolase n=1 Tax=Microbulbifer hydrolyticus TaxID=48074 RepID=A0A6P1TAV0_9GAMM|nr:hydroxyacylglutathione hydrolase [Microbulbifer hydrolyticus]MBB5210676.1 hydroxyacylglutathione hydrolase [Microbulbifer hydrolyticus]QHQ38865.1 hydroxyacylglutathione hydrolase [Microbulbifer hydrolyticus]